MKKLGFICLLMIAVASCSNSSQNEKKYIDDTVTHDADSPIIRDKSMVPDPDTTDRNLDDPATKKPDRMAH